MTYTAANGHKMVAVTTREDKDGNRVWDYWNAQHSPKCPCHDDPQDW